MIFQVTFWFKKNALSVAASSDQLPDYKLSNQNDK